MSIHIGCGGVAIYDNANLRPDTLTYNSGDFSRLAWGADASTLFAQSDSEVQPQTLDGLAVSPARVTVTGTLNSGSLGSRVHFDTGTNLLHSDSGVITNPVGPRKLASPPPAVSSLRTPHSSVPLSSPLPEQAASTRAQAPTRWISSTSTRRRF